MSRYAIEYSRQRGPQGANGNDGAGITAIPNNTLLGNTSGGAAIPVARTAVQMGLQPYSANLDRLDGTVEEQRAAIGAASIMDVTQTDFTETYRYYGGLIGSDWKINRYSTITFAKTSATIVNNSGQANLTAAWANRLTLNYA